VMVNARSAVVAATTVLLMRRICVFTFGIGFVFHFLNAAVCIVIKWFGHGRHSP
jgi:hypothetical protein